MGLSFKELVGLGLGFLLLFLAAIAADMPDEAGLTGVSLMGRQSLYSLIALGIWVPIYWLARPFASAMSVLGLLGFFALMFLYLAYEDHAAWDPEGEAGTHLILGLCCMAGFAVSLMFRRIYRKGRRVA